MSRVLIIVVLLFLCLSAVGAVWSMTDLVQQAEREFGAADPNLSFFQKISYSARLVWNWAKVTQSLDIEGKERPFEIRQGETASMIAKRLAQEGFISDAGLFEIYLLYAGLDTRLQAGQYMLSASSNMIEIAHMLQDATPLEVSFVILPGWRLEEIAATLPTSGLAISEDEFLRLSRNPKLINLPAGSFDWTELQSLEGFMLPDIYQVRRDITAQELIRVILANFNAKVTLDMRLSFEKQGLDLKQAVTLASIVQREAVVESEQPMIAGVFINRLNAGMLLQSDPTVQYALGYNQDKQTWWTNPLSADQLQVNSPFNTYLYPGLPPGPICNPSLEALEAVANPQLDPQYYYFRASCDGSGLHKFAVTYDEHLANACQ